MHYCDKIVNRDFSFIFLSRQRHLKITPSRKSLTPSDELRSFLFEGLDRLKRSSQSFGIMRKTLLHGLFPLVRAEILRLLFTNARVELYVRQLARLSHLSLQTVQDELAKLEAALLITSRSNGYHRFYRADPKHPLYATLRKLVVRGATQPKPQPKARGQRRAGRPQSEA